MTPKELQEAIDRFCDLENRVQELERQISTSTEDRTMSDAKELVRDAYMRGYAAWRCKESGQ